MLAATILSTSLLLSVPVPQLAEPELSDSWVGKSIILRASGAHLTQLDQRGEPTGVQIQLLGLDFHVFAERGNYVQLKTREAVMGWIDKKDVLLIDDALVYFSEKLNQNPADTNALNHRAWAWKMKGEHAAGIKDLTDAIRVSPAAAFHNNRARILVANEELDRAMADYHIAINMGPQHYILLFNRGVCWNLKKDPDKAIADLDRSLQLNSGYPDAHHQRGLAWLAKGDHDKAITDFSTAIRIDANSAPALVSRAEAWIAKKELAKARTDLDDAIRADASCAPAYFLRGQLSNLEKAHEKALADFNAALRLNPRHVQAYRERAAVLSSMQRYPQARADLERGAHFDVSHEGTATALALFLAACPDANLRDGKRATAIAERELKHDPAHADALEAFAAARAEVGDFDEAIRVQQRALKVSRPDNAVAVRGRLELYRKKQPFRQN